jgi:molybdopterin converting factor small subunit
VTIEVTTWVTKYVGGDGSGSHTFEEPVTPGQTVREVLRRFTAQFPELDAALWDHARAQLGEHIEVLVNDAVLGVTHELDSPLAGGERITLLGQFMGGSLSQLPMTGSFVRMAWSPEVTSRRTALSARGPGPAMTGLDVERLQVLAGGTSE